MKNSVARNSSGMAVGYVQEGEVGDTGSGMMDFFFKGGEKAAKDAWVLPDTKAGAPAYTKDAGWVLPDTKAAEDTGGNGSGFSKNPKSVSSGSSKHAGDESGDAGGATQAGAASAGAASAAFLSAACAASASADAAQTALSLRNAILEAMTGDSSASSSAAAGAGATPDAVPPTTNVVSPPEPPAPARAKPPPPAVVYSTML